MNQQRREFAAFLRARRAELAPQDVGLHTADHPRRVPGLRREEVAGRAGISSDYYTRLEQGRLPAPSGRVLDALATALLLDADQRDYLRLLAGHAPARRRPHRRQSVPAPVQVLLTSLTAIPALVLGRFMDVLAWNPLAADLLTDFGAVAPARRNYLRLAILDPNMRERLIDWERTVGECIAFLRMDASRYPTDERLATLIDDLSRNEPHFQHWWTTHQVARNAIGRKRLHHPTAGEIHLHWQVLTVMQDPDQYLVVLTPADPSSGTRLATLATHPPRQAPADTETPGHPPSHM
ncbi:helix-turn-helix domain-containing protein [Nonomuraea sp. NPDC050394]|uniref:helix-turn-helix domain-containing protein n=1 Tax=Nonomuraea sp. NPDC050394 TaxID=3364363 RepID=UPI00378F3E2D